MDIKIVVDGKEYTLDEARELYMGLKNIFDRHYMEIPYVPEIPIYPNYPSYTPWVISTTTDNIKTREA
jgi:hypothetical protein